MTIQKFQKYISLWLYYATNPRAKYDPKIWYHDCFCSNSNVTFCLARNPPLGFSLAPNVCLKIKQNLKFFRKSFYYFPILFCYSGESRPPAIWSYPNANLDSISLNIIATLTYFSMDNIHLSKLLLPSILKNSDYPLKHKRNLF